ncbi:FusB/FusC family EF-G-binding protein [Bacillus sp. CLL-7-23]|uniref:FusB/FusC family EF-G-binding protein n=1 Tax=Bacillus changyiensis TaxID=3004103 RepID=A0ABT4X455_9BACI|nr:FusB/FusC family EF-G-binding protein [Bacillus changyiensis]MDA7027064.1 FusB/FusC family EF-G-binding protein [Bacillus changyiensis]
MDVFIRNDQYHFIKFQTQSLVLGHASVKDTAVLEALKSSALAKVLDLFPDLTSEQRALVSRMVDIKESVEAEQFLSRLKLYVIPFQQVTAKTVKKLFPKVKKLKMPALDDIELTEYSYLGWNDTGSGRKYMIVDVDGKLMGIHGTIKHSHKKGVCSLCHKIDEVGLFMSRVKSGKETYTDRGNYICYDSEKCNQNISTLDHLHDFINQLKK